MAYSTINKSTDYFNTKLYTGNESTRSETGVGFQPDFTWIKVRSRADPHILTDAVRGTSSQLSSNTDGAQQTFSNMITSFNSDGFSLGANVDVNRNSETFASWNWKANGAGSANTDGTTNSTVSVNTTAGFSIVTYTGNSGGSGYSATIGHGLGVAPEMIIVKSKSGSRDWFVYLKSLGATKYLRINSTDGEATHNSIWYDTAPTSSVFTVGTNTGTNGVGEDYIAYCFAPKTGYSKFGSYTGNGADGSTTNNFIYTGFKPTFVMVKRSNDSGQQWTICDTTRSPSNVSGSMEWLFSDSDGVETDEDLPYMLSNGFMPRTGHTYMNRSGFSYIYMAFGQSIVGSNNIPATAR